MNAREFFDAVVEMRKAQSKYFRMRTTDNLNNAKKLERVVDDEIRRVDEELRRHKEPPIPFK